MSDSNQILFVCVENSGRSQMAEAFFRKLSSQNFIAISAGTKPSSNINPIVAKVMKEVGIDISENLPKSLSSNMINLSFKTINMGCIDKESCPALFVKDILDWGIEDPKGKSIEQVRKIRDEIEIKVKELIQKLENRSL